MTQCLNEAMTVRHSASRLTRESKNRTVKEARPEAREQKAQNSLAKKLHPVFHTVDLFPHTPTRIIPSILLSGGGCRRGTGFGAGKLDFVTVKDRSGRGYLLAAKRLPGKMSPLRAAPPPSE